MKKFLLVTLTSLIGFIFLTCKKSAQLIITGKWNIVNDDLSSGGRFDSFRNYSGKPGDYFEFGTNNTLYIKEDTLFDTMPYQLMSNNKIILPGLGITLNDITEPSNISINSNKVTIVANPLNMITPVGAYQRTIGLKR